jgi:hypothetical protein
MANIAGPARLESAAEASLRTWFEEQEKAALSSLEEGARQIIQLVTALLGLMLGVLALGSDKLEASLQQPGVIIPGLVAVAALLVAVVAALVVVLPLFGYGYNPAQPATQQQAWARMLRRKVIGLRLAVIAFGLGLAALAWLIVTMLLARLV